MSIKKTRLKRTAQPLNQTVRMMSDRGPAGFGAAANPKPTPRPVDSGKSEKNK